jgi:hypothetical protein
MIKIYTKTRLIIISVILVALLLLTAGIWIKRLSDSPLIRPYPSYKFLAEKEPKIANNRYEYDSSLKATRHIFSFMGDFTDIYSAAGNELRSLGYFETKHSRTGKYWTRSFHLHDSPPKGFTEVLIHENQMLNPRSTPEIVLYKFRNGWISVEIIQAKIKLRWQLYANKLLNQEKKRDQTHFNNSKIKR